MQRPKEFDAKVMAYLPALKKLARKLANNDADELVQDTFIYVLSHWQNFRGDPAQPKSGFYNWLTLNMRSIAQGRRGKERTQRKYMPVKNDPDGYVLANVSTAPRQEDITYANQVVRRLSRSREGRMLVRLGGGEMLKDVAAKRGIGVERVRQLTERARERLMKNTKVAAFDA